MEWNSKGKQRQYTLGVKHIGGNDREIDVDLLLYGSKSSESLSDLVHDTESESDFSFEASDGIGKRVINTTASNAAACYQGTFDMPTTKKERRNPLLIKQNRYLHYLNEEFVNGAGRRDNVEDDDDINEMERCMSHFDKVLEEQSTHPINETKLPYKQRIEGRITGQTDRDESLSKGIKKDGGRFVMQRHDLDEYKSFRETYGEGEESYHDIQDKWDDLDIKQARIKYEQEIDAKILMSTSMVSKVRCRMCGVLCHPKRNSCDICRRHDRSCRSCDQSEGSCDHHNRGNYEAGIGRRGDESSIGLEQTRLVQLQLQKGTQLIKQQQERTFCLQQKKNCANSKHEAALPAGGLVVNATLPTLSHKSMTDPLCGSSLNSLPTESETYVQGGGYSIHNDINSARLVQPISLERKEGMDSCLQKERHLPHVDVASEWNEDTCVQSTLTQEEEKVGHFNGHKGVIEDCALDREAIVCHGVKMDDKVMQLPLLKKEDVLKKEEKPLQSDADKLQVVRSGEDIASKKLALKPGTVTDTDLDVINCSMANIDDCSIGSQDSCKDISSSNLASAFDGFRKCDMIETIDSSTNSIGAVGYIDSPGTIPLDCIREDSAFHGGNSARVKSGDSAEYSLGNTICDSNTSAVKAIPQNDGEGVSLHQCNMPNEIQLEQEHKGHKCGRQFESLQSSKLKNQYAGITVDIRGNEKSPDLVQSTQDSQRYYEWHEAKQPHSDSVESLNQTKGYQIAGLKEELGYEKGSQIVISKQDLLKCGGTRHSNLEGSSCVQGNESSLGDIHTDMKNEKTDLFWASGSEASSKPFENKTKLRVSGIQCTSNQVISHNSGGTVYTGNQDFQCQRQVPKENIEIYSPLRETDECNITCSDKSAMLYTETMGVPNIRQGNFCSDGDTKTRNEAQIRTDIACATGEYNRNQGHKGIHEILRNPGDNKCQSVQNNNASKENMFSEQRPLENPASSINPHGNDGVLRRKNAYLNYHSKTMKAGVKLRGGAKRRDPKLRYSASDIETLKKRYTMEPICMVADCTKCTKMTLENALLEDDYARLRNLQASHAEHQTDKSRKAIREDDVTEKAKDALADDDDANDVPKETRGYIGTVKLRDRKPRVQPTGSQCVANRNLSRNASTSSGRHGDDSCNDNLMNRSSSMRPNSNVLSMRNANKVVSSSSDEEGIICGCMANVSSRQRAHRAQSMYEPYIRDVNNSNRYVSDSDSDNSVASYRCRRTRSLYGMRPRKPDGAEEGLFSDVIDSYLAKSQSLSGGLDPRKNRYSLGDMPWLNEDEMKDGFLRPRAQRNDNSGYWRDNNSAGYNSGRLHGNIIDNSFFQRMRENLHQFDRNNRRNKRNENERGDGALMEVVQKDSISVRSKEEIQCQQNTQAHSQEGDSNCQFSQNDRNHLHQSCDLIAQKIGESEQKSRSMFEIAESHRERQQCNEDYFDDSDASDESRLSLSYFVDMEKSVIIQSDITEHYRTDKIQYLESSSIDSLEETTTITTTTMTTANDTPATYKYNANTQMDLNPTRISNNKHHQQYNARFKTETKTTLLDKMDRSNQNAMETSTSGEICNKKIIEKEVDENEPKPKVPANVPQPKKSDEPAIIKPRQRLEVDLRKMKLTNENLMLRSIQEIDALIQLFYGQIQDVSEDLVVLLQERHELREQVDMRRIAVEQLVRLQNTDMRPITDLIDLDSCKISALPSPTKSERGSPKKSPASSS